MPPTICSIVDCEKKGYGEGLCYAHLRAWRKTLDRWMTINNVKRCKGKSAWGGAARVHDGCCSYPAPWPDGAKPEGTYKTMRQEWADQAKVAL